jgi:DNA-directed RNA polymerase subunit RPC12/RpoP
VFNEEQFTVSDEAYYIDGCNPSLMKSFKNVTPMQRKSGTFMKSQPMPSGKQSDIFQCMRCGNSYKYKRSLDDHVRLECGKLPQFQCPYCPYRAKRNGNRLKHIRNVHHKQT